MASKLVALMLLCSTAVADTSLRLGGLSTHLSDKDYNSFHRVLILEHDSYFGGYFRNSYYDDSFIAGKRFGDDVGLLTGLTYGYRKDSSCYKYQGVDNYSDRIVCPFIGVDLRFDLPYKPSLTAAPGFINLTFGIDL